MFSLFRAKIAAFVTLIVGILLAVVKFQSKKIDKLDHENKIYEEKDEIQEQQIIDKIEVAEDEVKRIDERIKKTEHLSRSERASRL